MGEKKVFKILGLTVLVCSIFEMVALQVNSPSITPTGDNNGSRFVKSPKIADTHAPIYIDSNANFATQAAANGWTGDGTVGNPYVIENLVIITNAYGQSAIDIRNTNVYFVIRNSNVSATGSGGFPYYPSGICLISVFNGLLENNTAHHNFVHGFSLWYSSHNTLINNTGLYNHDYGFYLEESPANTLINNTALYNSGHGFTLCGSNNNTLIYNTARGSTEYGVYLDYPSGNDSIMYNNFYANHAGGTQAYSELSTNLFDYNYWDEHTTPDADLDGIVDTPYTIAGGGGLSDVHPFTEPHIFTPYPPTAPQLAVINPNPSINGSITLNWNDMERVTSYRIYRSTSMITDVGALTPIAIVDQATYQNTGLENGTYYYVITAVNASGASDISNCENVTVAIPPLVPQPPNAPILQTITPNPSITGNVTLSWTLIIGATSYRIYRATSLITEVGTLTPIATVNQTTYQNTGLENGSYYYVITAVNASGASDISNCEFCVVGIPPLEIAAYPLFFIFLGVIFSLVRLIGLQYKRSGRLGLIKDTT